jgi:hypothetical protein
MQVYFKYITNLADARCVTAWGAHYLSFMLGRGHDLKVDEGLVHTITPWLAGTQVVLDFHDDHQGYRETVLAFDESVYWFSLYLDYGRMPVAEANYLLNDLPRLPHIVELAGVEASALGAVLRELPAELAGVEVHVSPADYLATETELPILLNTDRLGLYPEAWSTLGSRGFNGVSFNQVVRPNSPFELDYDVCEAYLQALGHAY